MLALAACLALLTASPEAGPIKIGGYYPLTGGSAAMGTALRNGAHLAAEEVNAAGGVLGRKVVIVDADDEGKPDKGAQIVKDFADKERVVAILGPGNTGVANVSTGIANERHIPQIIPCATGNKVNELFKEAPQNYVFRLAASDIIQSQMMVTEAFAARGRRRPAILSDETPYGAQGRARLVALLEQRGVKPVYEGTLKVGEKDMTAHVKAARDASADVLLLYALGNEGAAVARSLEKIGWKPEIIGTWILSSAAFTKAAGPFGEGTVIPQTFIESGVTDPTQLRFIESYRKAYGTAHIEPAPAAAQGYDALHLLALAIRQAGTTEGPKVKAALEDIKDSFVGATGEYFKPWSSGDHEAVTPANVVWGMVKEGGVVPAPMASAR
jgi:branched-chain amino acid transport system substrate-binding protein